MPKEVVRLNPDELEPVQDHLRVVININDQIRQLRMQLIREQRDLQISFSNGMRRDMLERGVNGDIPLFIGSDGMLNLQVNSNGIVTWLPGREPKETKEQNGT